MGHNLHANNNTLKPFHMAGAWFHLLGQCGYYFTCVSQGARWFMIYDERMTTHSHGEDKEYPAIICNCGFEITEEEAKVLARIARNYAAIQHTLEKPTDELTITTPDYLKPFPKYIQREWVDLYERFADWAEQSNGFSVH